MKVTMFILFLLSSCNRQDEYLAQRRKQFHVGFRNSYISCNKISWENKGYTLTECDTEVKQVINATNIIIYE